MTVIQFYPLQAVAALEMFQGGVGDQRAVVQFDYLQAVMSTGAVAQVANPIVGDQLAVGQTLPPQRKTNDKIRKGIQPAAPTKSLSHSLQGDGGYSHQTGRSLTIQPKESPTVVFLPDFYQQPLQIWDRSISGSMDAKQMAQGQASLLMGSTTCFS